MPSHMKMLCVDDNPDLRWSPKEQFEMENFSVDTATDGDDALEKIKRNNYDIVLLDVKMPKMGGIDVLKEMKKHNKYQAIKS